jgi:hypothetical protein
MTDGPETWSATIHGLPDRAMAEATWRILLGDGSDVPPGITFSVAPDGPTAEVERLRAALERYGSHTNDCRWEDLRYGCTCGWDALEEAP